MAVMIGPRSTFSRASAELSGTTGTPVLAGFGVFAADMGPAAANAGPAWGCRKSRLVSGILRNVIGAGADTSDSVSGAGAAIGIVRSGIMLWARLMEET